MGALGLFGWVVEVARASVFAIFLAHGVAVQLEVCWLWLLLVAFRRGSPRLLVLGIFLRGAVLESSRALNGFLSIERTRLAVGARVGKVLAECLFLAVRVIALNVLPCITSLAVYRVSIIIRKVADALDRIRLLLNGLSLARRGGLRNGDGWRNDMCLTRNRNLRRQRLRIFGHTLRRASRWYNCGREGYGRSWLLLRSGEHDDACPDAREWVTELLFRSNDTRRGAHSAATTRLSTIVARRCELLARKR